MVTCAFFGHRECPPEIDKCLEAVLTELICNRKVCRFLVGDSGQYDLYCRKVLKRLKAIYPQIFYYIVLSHMPTTSPLPDEREVTILPEGIETAPPRFAIDRRNRWLLQNADIVVCYVKQPFGGAHKFMQLAVKKTRLSSIWPKVQTNRLLHDNTAKKGAESFARITP